MRVDRYAHRYTKIYQNEVFVYDLATQGAKMEMVKAIAVEKICPDKY